MLLNKSELELAKLAPTEESRYALQAICVQPESSTITNGHYLVSMKHSELANSEENFPVTPRLEHKKLQDGPAREHVLVSKDAAIAAAKALGKKTSIPVLATAAIGTDKTLYVNNLDSVQTFKHEASGTFPNWQSVIPTGKPKAQICVNAAYLEMLAKFLREQGNKPTAVRLTIYDDSTSLRMDAKTASGQDVLVLLMPVRFDSVDFAKTPFDLAKQKKDAAKKEEVANEDPAQS